MRGSVRWLLLVALVVALVPLGAVTAGADGGCGAEGCTACGTWQEVPLYAGQSWQVGVVRINNCADKIGVQYVLYDSVTAPPSNFRITEIHLDIDDELKQIPQTKTKNPIPGAFEISESFPNGVSSTGVYCVPREADWTTGKKLYIAAHAVVGRPALTVTEERPFCIVSGTGTNVIAGGVATPATLAWEHSLWNPSLTRDLKTEFGAQWIWNAYRTLQPVTGEIVEFSREFELEGVPKSGTLFVTADNGFEAKVNTNLVGDSGNLAAGWRSSDLTEPWVDTSAGVSSWATVRSFDVGAVLNTGTNEIAVSGVNEQMDGGTIDSNPAGVIYALCGVMDVELYRQDEVYETAWGSGPGFPGKNWATYSEYTIQPCCTVTCIAPYYPIEVVDWDQGVQKNGAPVLAARSNPEGIKTYDAAQTDASFFSLGLGGWIIGRYGCRVPDGTGSDLVVVEDTWGAYPLEQAKVWASQDGITWYYLGMANNLTRNGGDTIHTWSSFDLAGAKASDASDAASTPLAWAQYVKVVDATPVSSGSPATFDGFDLNTIRALQDGLTCE